MKHLREIVVDALVKVEKEGAYLQLVLKKDLEILESRDRGLATEIATGTLKYQIAIDYIINQVSSIKVSKMKPFIRNLMRISVYQLRYLDKVPAHAAINEAVKLAKSRGFAGLSKFVNGVLRSIERSNIALPAKNWSVYYSIPEWIIELWVSSYGSDIAKQICESTTARAEVVARVNTLKVSRDELVECLKLDGLATKPAAIFEDEYLYLEGAQSIADMPSFVSGFFTIQDESAGIVAHVVAPQDGELILDMCSAPGGKATHIAQIADVNIVSADIYEHKVELIKKNSARLGIGCIDAVCLDATVFVDEFCEKFDKVLIDVPCSGLGLLKRKPDIKYTRAATDVSAINQLQRTIAATAVRYLKPGGILIYSTCTLVDIENTDMVDYIADELGMVRDDIAPFVPSAFQNYVDGCYANIFPFVANTDGFFVARFIKN
ncbi:16S rRNA (cytosine(967)-C(5))-methyltransferase RsmB [Candidatus Epulonipiscium viviparus]|uniref:16S rRNA (cytosine(967)-C(5))-methyltransferase RsmB n=1 Tax=Candidatus Epulonipiscium viviparus TaxID=420336 RepID=UPI0027380B61|nr:16S rRNA (cytosine(967)-C(5))-methyltransferase RsmB [Candidatus Epulopiscium viviparus]